jgi:hypothetical protein
MDFNNTPKRYLKITDEDFFINNFLQMRIDFYLK